MHNFRKICEATGDVRHSVRETLRTTGHALLVTSIVLSLAFFVYMFASLENLVLFGLLSAEPYLHSLRNAHDPDAGWWSAQMWLTIVWSIFATGVLALGFWRKHRGVRFAALGLYAVTALKLVLVDMAQLEEVYRIVSFFVMGVLMIAASYLYHKVEKQLMARGAA